MGWIGKAWCARRLAANGGRTRAAGVRRTIAAGVAVSRWTHRSGGTGGSGENHSPPSTRSWPSWGFVAANASRAGIGTLSGRKRSCFTFQGIASCSSPHLAAGPVRGGRREAETTMGREIRFSSVGLAPTEASERPIELLRHSRFPSSRSFVSGLRNTVSVRNAHNLRARRQAPRRSCRQQGRRIARCRNRGLMLRRPR